MTAEVAQTSTVDRYFEVFLPQLEPLKLVLIADVDISGSVAGFRLIDAEARLSSTQGSSEVDVEGNSYNEIFDLVNRAVTRFLNRYHSVARTYDDKWTSLLENLKLSINESAVREARNLGSVVKAVQVDPDARDCAVAVEKVTANSCVLKVTRLPLDGEFLDVMIEGFDFSAPSAFKPTPEIPRVDRVPISKHVEIRKLKSSRWHRLRIRSGETGKWSEAVEITTSKLNNT